MKVYFDNASTSPIDLAVKKEMIDSIENFHGNPSSIHSIGRETRAKIEKARKTVANGINAGIGEIFFTSSATESNNAILRMCAQKLGVERIISSPTEHPCVLNTCKDLQGFFDFEVEWLSVNDKGEISVDELEKKLGSSQKKTLVSLMYGNNEIGTIHPLMKIAEVCKTHNALLHSDAVQVLGKYPIDVQELPIHFMTGTAHKFYGPKGSGFMYINSAHILAPFHTGGSQERNMRAGTENVYGIVGLAKAFELSLEHMTEREEKTRSIRNYMKEKLSAAFEDVLFLGAQEGKFLYHILSVSFPSSPKNEMLIYNLDIHGICASMGSACSSGTNTGSHVIRAIRPDCDRITIRFSFSYHNTKEEVDYVVGHLVEMLEI